MKESGYITKSLPNLAWWFPTILMGWEIKCCLAASLRRLEANYQPSCPQSYGAGTGTGGPLPDGTLFWWVPCSLGALVFHSGIQMSLGDTGGRKFSVVYDTNLEILFLHLYKACLLSVEAELGRQEPLRDQRLSAKATQHLELWKKRCQWFLHLIELELGELNKSPPLSITHRRESWDLNSGLTVLGSFPLL